MRDRRQPAQAVEAVAVVHERLRPHRQRRAADFRVGALERRRQRVGQVQAEGVTDEADLGGDRHPEIALQTGHERPEFALNLAPRAVRQPAARPLQPALLRRLVVNLAGVNLADEDTFLPGQRIGTGR